MDPIIPFNEVSYYSPDHLTFPYEHYEQTITYHWDNGQLQLPVAYSIGSTGSTTAPSESTIGTPSDDTSPPYAARSACVIIQVCEPYGRKIVHFDAERQAVQPVIPDPTPVSANEVLITADVTLHAPKLSGNGTTHIFGAAGQYVYALSQPYYTDDNLTGGTTPEDTADVSLGQMDYPYFWDYTLTQLPSVIAAAPVPPSTPDSSQFS